jgi:hypothetical protein
MMICINCENDHNNKFCPECGEKVEVPKITFSSIFAEGFSRITTMDKGLLFNLKNLLLNPKRIVIDYINGKRKSIFNPISFLLICITIYLIGESFLQAEKLVDTNTIEKMKSNKIFSIGFEAGKFIESYFKYFWILSVLWLSFATKLCFGRFSFAEHLAINSFIIGQTTLFALIGYLVLKVPLLYNPVVFILTSWMLYQVFKKKKKDLDAIILSISSVLLFFIQLFLLTISIGIARSM